MQPSWDFHVVWDHADEKSDVFVSVRSIVNVHDRSGVAIVEHWCSGEELTIQSIVWQLLLILLGYITAMGC